MTHSHSLLWESGFSRDYIDAEPLGCFAVAIRQGWQAIGRTAADRTCTECRAGYPVRLGVARCSSSLRFALGGHSEVSFFVFPSDLLFMFILLAFGSQYTKSNIRQVWARKRS
jgi:hypothetical protein